MLVGVVAGLSVLFAGTVSAAHPGPPSGDGVQPAFVAGNPSCLTLLPAADFLFEHKTGVPIDETIPLSFGGLTGSVTVDVRNTSLGQVFDFSFTGDFLAIAVIVKGGPNANFYDYRPAGNAADTGLHAPVNHSNNMFFGLSHISFCIGQAEAELQIVKTAVDDTITVGENAEFDITVTNLGPATAKNVVIDDTLPTGLTWTDNKAECTITSGNVLHCDVGDLAANASFTVRVSAPIPAGTAAANAARCDTVLDNDAFADADNADQVTDDAQITIQCGGIKVSKTAKHADTTGATSPNLAATFDITDSKGNTHTVMTDASTGVACLDDLPLGAATVDEITGPSGYQADPDVENVTVTDADCPNPGAGATASFENVPLTDVDIDVDSLQDGATSTRIICDNGVDQTVSDGSVIVANDEEPQTINCQIIIDP